MSCNVLTPDALAMINAIARTGSFAAGIELPHEGRRGRLCDVGTPEALVSGQAREERYAGLQQSAL